MAQSVILSLIRHGQTAANQQRQYIGSTDEPLIETLPRCTLYEPMIVYGSDLMRCVQTAHAYFPHATYEADERLREIHFGDYELQTYAQLQHDQHYRAWIDNPFTTTPPNGESLSDFVARVDAAFVDIVQTASHYTFVVHGGVIRHLLTRFSGNGLSFSYQQAAHHTCYTLTWDSLHDWKEGQLCTSLSVVPITANALM